MTDVRQRNSAATGVEFQHLTQNLSSAELLGSCPHPSSSENAEANTKKVVVERNGNHDANGNAHADSRITCVATGHVQSSDVGAYAAPWKGHCARLSHVPPEYR